MPTPPAKPEVWLRGPLPGITPLLQPVAHALLQAREEVGAAMADFPEELLWTRPADAASVGFHLQHLAGVLDRLFTYARGEALTEAQQEFLGAEGLRLDGYEKGELLEAFSTQVERAIERLREISPEVLIEPRTVGRGRLPSTVMGLLVHAAEHTMRHVGQLLVTARIQRLDHPS